MDTADQSPTTMEDAYCCVEEHAAGFDSMHEIVSVYQRLRDQFHKAKDDQARFAQWEMDFFNFRIKENQLKPFFSGVDKDGHPNEYPSLSSFTEETYCYLLERQASCTSPVTVARYSHLLWLSPKKEHSYARKATDAYLELVEIYLPRLCGDRDFSVGTRLLTAVENVFHLGHQVNYRADEVDGLVADLAATSTSSSVRSHLLDFVVQNMKRFDKAALRQLVATASNLAGTCTRERNHHAAIAALHLGESLQKASGDKTRRRWDSRIAEAYERLMVEASATENMACVDFCQDALLMYRQIGNRAKVAELEASLAEMKRSMRMGKVEHQFDRTEILRKAREIAEAVTCDVPERVIVTLAADKGLLPQYEDVKKTSAELSKQFVLTHIMPTHIVDANGNTAQHFSDPHEKEYYEILQHYQHELQMVRLPIIHEIFMHAIRANKLNADVTLGFLRAHSWLGRTLAKKSPDGRVTEDTWVSLVAPAICDFFREVEACIVNGSTHPNLVLTIDSLTLKMEGMIRDICRLRGITEFAVGRDRKGRKISREKDIHALLYEDAMTELFDPDDLLLFRFLLVEKAGYNLRHRVAHSLLTPSEYSLEKVYLLIIALLRLGKYDFAPNEETCKKDGGARNGGSQDTAAT